MSSFHPLSQDCMLSFSTYSLLLQGLKEDLNSKRSIMQGTVGAGMHRKICLATRITDHNKKKWVNLFECECKKKCVNLFECESECIYMFVKEERKKVSELFWMCRLYLNVCKGKNWSWYILLNIVFIDCLLITDVQTKSWKYAVGNIQKNRV